MAENKKLAATFKSQDTEGLLWANFFNFFGIHPNVVTILSIFLGAAAGVMFYFDNMTYTVIGILLLVWANLYDSADGQLARMTGKKTRWGRILDGFAGDVWFVAIYVAICLRLMPQWGIWISLVSSATANNANWPTTTATFISILSKGNREANSTIPLNSRRSLKDSHGVKTSPGNSSFISIATTPNRRKA